MPTYTVHEPPPRKNESVTAPERIVFVRDGFYFWAFVLAPIWLLVRRLWLALLIYVVLTIALGVGLALAHVPSSLRLLAEVLVALGVGLEAASVWRWTLTRRRWKTLGFVVGEDAEMAERRFFAAWTDRAPASDDDPALRPAPIYATPVRRGPASSNDVIGLFPEPGQPSAGMPR